MSKGLKRAIQKAKINNVLEQVAAVTIYESVAKELNEDGTVKTSLKEDLAAFTEALAGKAESTAVTEEIRTACADLYNKILGKANAETTIDEAYDTLKEIADWIGTHGTAATTLTNDVSGLKTSVDSLVQQMAGFKNTNVEASEKNGYINVDGNELKVYENQGNNVFVASTTEEAAAAEANMKNGDILLQVQ